MAHSVGLAPTAFWLTASCSTVELRVNGWDSRIRTYIPRVRAVCPTIERCPSGRECWGRTSVCSLPKRGLYGQANSRYVDFYTPLGHQPFFAGGDTTKPELKWSGRPDSNRRLLASKASEKSASPLPGWGDRRVPPPLEAGSQPARSLSASYHHCS